MKKIAIASFAPLAVVTLAISVPPAAAQEVPDAQKAVAEAEKIVKEAAARGYDLSAKVADSKACAILLSGLLEELFHVDPAAVRLKAQSIGADYCSATWDRPDRAERDAAYKEAIRAWAQSAGKGGKMPKAPALTYSVNLAVVQRAFRSAKEAVTWLESSVRQLNEGVKVKVQGKEREIKLKSGDWVDGIGDRAVERTGGIQVASKGRIFTVHVHVKDDEAANKELNLKFARRVIAQL